MNWNFKYTIFIITTLMNIFISCQKEDVSPSLLKQYSNNIFYSTNNKISTERLFKIIYEKQDSPLFKERFKIVHLSDPHLSSWSNDNNFNLPINLLEAISFSNQDSLRINAIVTTGDIIGNTNTTAKEEAIEYIASFTNFYYKQNKIPSFFCLGNHDTNVLSKDSKNHINSDEIYQLTGNKSNYYRHQLYNDNYFYSDVSTPTGEFIRFISLDMTDQKDFIYDTQHYANFSQKQIDWLCNIALKKGLSDKHHIIILTHFPFQPYSANWKTLLCDGDFIHAWYMIPEIIEAFRKKEQLTKKYNSIYNGSSTINVNIDFQSIPGDFICYLGGHSHITTNFEINNLSNASIRLPKQKMLLCTNQAPSEIGTIYNKVIREKNSITSNSFCIYCIDLDLKKIFITFFGAYKPTNVENYPEIQEINY